VIALAFAAALAGELRQIELYRSGADGYALFRIPGIVATKRGTLLAYAEARRTARGDWGTIDIVLRRSEDRGRTWSPYRAIAQVDGPKSKNPVALAQNLASPEDITYNNPVAIADRSGAVHFLFCLEYMRAFYMRSDDDGRTFSKPVEITATFDEFRKDYAWKVLAIGPGHGIQLRGGRLLAPVWISTGTGGHAHRPSVTSTIYSDDGGRTWKRGAIAVPDTPEFVFPNETTAVELSDGRVMLNVRTEAKAHRRTVVVSADGANGWSAPRFDQTLLEPICFGSILGLGGRRIVFSNPDDVARRRNLTVQLSEDDGATWTAKRTLEPEWSGYSDLASGKGGKIYCFYERGAQGGNAFRSETLTLAEFDLGWIKKGR
jgi:sialidase-1